MQGHVALMKGVVDIGAHVGQAKRMSISIAATTCTILPAILIHVACHRTGKAKPGSVELSIECQGSSIGTYSAQWLQEFYSSCSGAPVPQGYFTGPISTPIIKLFDAL